MAHKLPFARNRARKDRRRFVGRMVAAVLTLRKIGGAFRLDRINFSPLRCRAVKLLLAFFGGGGVGGFLGAYLAHRFTERRDRQNRKRNFRGFLAEWRAIVEQTIPQEKIISHYFDHVRAFRKEAERVRGDFANEQAFSERVKALGHMNPNEIAGDDTRKRVGNFSQTR